VILLGSISMFISSTLNNWLLQSSIRKVELWEVIQLLSVFIGAVFDDFEVGDHRRVNLDVVYDISLIQRKVQFASSSHAVWSTFADDQALIFNLLFLRLRRHHGELANVTSSEIRNSESSLLLDFIEVFFLQMINKALPFVESWSRKLWWPIVHRVLPLCEFGLSLFVVTTLIRNMVLVVAELKEWISLLFV